MFGALLVSCLVSAPTPEAALAEILPPSAAELTRDLALPGLPRPGPGVDFEARATPGSTPQAVIAELVARSRGRVIFARRLTIPLRTRRAVPVPKRLLPPGHVITADDVELREVYVPSSALVVLDLDAVVGRETRRAVAAGQPVPRRAVEAAAVVSRGDSVRVAVVGAGFRVIMEAEALESGAQGEAVRVVNGQSNQVVRAVVVGPGELEVQL